MLYRCFSFFFSFLQFLLCFNTFFKSFFQIKMVFTVPNVPLGNHQWSQSIAQGQVCQYYKVLTTVRRQPGFQVWSTIMQSLIRPVNSLEFRCAFYYVAFNGSVVSLGFRCAAIFYMFLIKTRQCIVKGNRSDSIMWTLLVYGASVFFFQWLVQGTLVCYY